MISDDERLPGEPVAVKIDVLVGRFTCFFAVQGDGGEMYSEYHFRYFHVMIVWTLPRNYCFLRVLFLLAASVKSRYRGLLLFSAPGLLSLAASLMPVGSVAHLSGFEREFDPTCCTRDNEPRQAARTRPHAFKNLKHRDENYTNKYG